MLRFDMINFWGWIAVWCSDNNTTPWRLYLFPSSGGGIGRYLLDQSVIDSGSVILTRLSSCLPQTFSPKNGNRSCLRINFANEVILIPKELRFERQGQRYTQCGAIRWCNSNKNVCVLIQHLL